MASNGARRRTSFFNNPLFSDIKIRQIKDGAVREYYGHKAVLSERSGWFLTTFDGAFKEATAATIDIHDDDPEHFELMIRYLYTHKFEVDSLGDDSVLNKSFIATIGVNILADKYDIDGLSEIAVDRFAKGHPYTLQAATVTLSDADLPSMIRSYYQSTPSTHSSMGICISKYLLEYAHTFMNEQEFVDLVHTFPVLGADVVFSEKSLDCLGRCRKPDCMQPAHPISKLGRYGR